MQDIHLTLPPATMCHRTHQNNKSDYLVVDQATKYNNTNEPMAIVNKRTTQVDFRNQAKRKGLMNENLK